MSGFRYPIPRAGFKAARELLEEGKGQYTLHRYGKSIEIWHDGMAVGHITKATLEKLERIGHKITDK